MKFTKFRDTLDEGKPDAGKMVRVNSSEASHRDALPVPAREVESFGQEYERLKVEKLKLESNLGISFSGAAFATAQAKIRANGDSAASLSKWLRKKQEMHAERAVLVEKIREIEVRLVKIKPRVIQEHSDEDTGK